MPLTEYERYLRVPELLSLQKPEEARTHEDELLFQSVHQIEEIWMKAADDEISRLVPAMDRDELEAARMGLHRIYLIEKLMGDQMRLLETMAPVAYFAIRKGLGHGSGLESPGFNRLLRTSKKVIDAFDRACARHEITPEDLVRDPSRHRALWAIAEVMIDVDEAFQSFRYRHLVLVKRIIGAGTPSLKGNPIELLENNAKKMFFPTLWRAREALFNDFVPGGLEDMTSPILESDLLATRPDFPTLAKGVHLISHSLGAVPRQARTYVTQFMDEWENESINAWGTWLPAVRSLGELVGSVLGVERNSVAILPNVSTVQSFVASCFAFPATSGRFKGRNKVVYDDVNFSTVHYVWQEQARRGAVIEIVKSRDGIAPPIDELCAAIDEKTLLVPISHVLFRSSGMYDAKRVIDRAHEVGALVLLDCYQSAGTVPLDLRAWDCDMACGGSVKWVCGGPGAAYLYVRPDLLEHLNPTSTGWFAHAEPFSFDMGPMRYAADVWRMIGGTMAIPAVYTARAGWETIARLGVEKIRAKSLRQTRLLRELVDSRGFTVNTPRNDDERGGTICFDFPGADEVSRTLSARKFFHDYRPKCGLRLSPHFYTTDEELTHFMSELDEVRRSSPMGGVTAY